jgi:hypothetical protein
MRTTPLLLLAALLGACSSTGSSMPDATSADATPGDAPNLDAGDAQAATSPEVALDQGLGPDAIGLPAAFLYLKWTTTAVADAGDPVSRTMIGVWPDGKIRFEDNGTPPLDGMMSAAELRDFAALMNGAGTFDELRSPVACGPQAADYRESLIVAVPGAEVQKEITLCHQPAYEQLRPFLRSLMSHFRSPLGTCAAPNVWRYMSPGCGAQAHPVCGTASQDACAAPRCSCDGRDIIGCDYTAEPYAHVGSCRDGGR